MKYFYLVVLLGSILLLTNSKTLAQGNVYAGAALGLSTFDYNDVDKGTASKLYIGFESLDHLAIETRYYNSGNADITSQPGFSINTEGFNLAVLYTPTASLNEIRVMAGAGIYNFNTTVKGFGSATVRSKGLSLHGALQIPLTDGVEFRGDIDAFAGVEDFAENNTIISLHAGIVLLF